MHQTLKHKNILESYCTFVNDSEIWVVMPLMGYGESYGQHCVSQASHSGYNHLLVAPSRSCNSPSFQHSKPYARCYSEVFHELGLRFCVSSVCTSSIVAAPSCKKVKSLPLKRKVTFNTE